MNMTNQPPEFYGEGERRKAKGEVKVMRKKGEDERIREGKR
jgi:hypothetical protein